MAKPTNRPRPTTPNRSPRGRNTDTAEQIARLQIVSELWLHGNSLRTICEEVKRRLNLDTYSVSTCKADKDYLLHEWQEHNLESVDQNIRLELARIDELIKEAWEGWIKSKENSKRTIQKQRAMPNVEGEGASADDVAVVFMEQQQTEDTSYGDPRYLELINKLLNERRKILGLYAPEKREVTGKNGAPIQTESKVILDDIIAALKI